MNNLFALKKDGNNLNYVAGAEGLRLSEPLFALNNRFATGDQQTFFETIQENLRGMVLACLVLYVTIFGLKVVISQQIPDKGTFIMAVLKFSLVLYFTLGTGIVDFVPRLIEMSKAMSLILMESSKNLPIQYIYCDFSTVGYPSNNPNPEARNLPDYPAGQTSMALWDGIECKLSN
jgi:hypothetical protein